MQVVTMSDTYERFKELVSNYGIDTSKPNPTVEVPTALLVEMMEHLQRLDRMIYHPMGQEVKLSGNDFTLVDIPGEIDKILDGIDSDLVEHVDGHEIVRGHDMINNEQFNNVQTMEEELKYEQPPVPGHDCQAVKFSDLMVCDYCGLTWDTNDPNPPKCKRDDNNEVIDLVKFPDQIKVCGNCNNRDTIQCPMYSTLTMPGDAHEICSEFVNKRKS